jgi:hypothetical protein
VVELKQDALVFSFPEVHRHAELRIDLQRTLRIPDDEREYPLPPGLGRFPLRHVDDFAERVPRPWLVRGGVMLPMYQSEALWLNFSSPHGYPFAVKVAAGRINAVTGDAWTDRLTRSPQDYVSVPSQPWLDGYCVEEGVIRQFVAMPLGSGYSAEEQLTGEAEHGGIQLLVHPLRREAYRPRVTPRDVVAEPAMVMSAVACYDMGLAPGGRMRQEIFDDPQRFGDWDLMRRGRCFVHLANSLVWRSVTGDDPPTTPRTAEEYERAGLPWFDYYSEERARRGAERLKGLKSVAALGRDKGEVPLPENQSIDPRRIVELRSGLKRNEVREGRF